VQLDGKREDDEEQAKIDRMAYVKRMMEGGNAQAHDDSVEALQNQLVVMDDLEAEERKRVAHERLVTKAKEVSCVAVQGV
jgi:hypothetical protein